MAISLVFHLLILFLLVRATADAVGLLAGENGLGDSGTGPTAGPAGGGGNGGELVTFVDVSGPPPAAAAPAPPVPEVVEPEEVLVVKPVPVREPDPEVTTTRPVVAQATETTVSGTGTDPDATGTGSGGEPSAGSGGGSGGGQGGGIGSGIGPGTGGGGGGAVVAEDVLTPPRPRGIFIPPPGRPASARGLDISIWMLVRADGRVDRSNIRLEPPTDDARYNRRLIESAAEWIFDPGRRNGTPEAAWFPLQVTL